MAQVEADLLDIMKTAGTECFPHEACGLVISQGKKTRAIPCRNIALDPQHHFLLAPEDYAAAADRGEVIGIWHTHVNLPSRASEADLAGVEMTELPWYILGIYEADGAFIYDELNIIEPSGREIEYVGRPYVFGILDCYALVRDFYRREYGIVLKEAPRVEKWWLAGHNFFEDLYEEVGFTAMTDAEPERGDLFLMQIGAPVSSHIAIYLGDEVILHHCYGRLSSRDIYGGYWQKHTVFHLRHSKLM